MFGLPGATAALVFGFPAFWLLYTLIFLWRTKDWSKAWEKEDYGTKGGGE